MTHTCIMYSESTHEIQMLWLIVYSSLYSGLSVNNAFYTRRPIGIL